MYKKKKEKGNRWHLFHKLVCMVINDLMVIG